MKSIVFTSPCTAELIEENIPQCGDNDVLVRMAISTISSGTERANLIGETNVSINPEYCKEAHFPRRSGYSSSGVVEKVGANVKSVRPGDRVAMEWSLHQEYVVRPENLVYRIPDSISFEEAALWHIATFPLAAIRKCKVEIGESAIVMGQGVLGRIAVKLLHAAGICPVIAADPVEAKRIQSLANGADYAFDPFDADFADKVKKETDGGVNAAIEVTGNGQALDEVLDCMAPFGRVALLGCTRHSDFSIDYYHKIHGPGITLIGAHTLARPKVDSSDGWWTEHDDMLTLIKLSTYRSLNLSSMVEETHSPSDAGEVYARLASEKAFPLVQFDWRKL